MAEIFQFKPKAELDAQSSVGEFIRRCRDDLTVFGEDLDWNSPSWKGVVNFTKAGVPARGFKDDQLLDPAITPFAKAYVRYQQGHNPTKLKNEIKALRCIEPALLRVKRKADITLVDISVLDEAIVVAREEYGASAYQAGTQLTRLAKFLSKNRMIASPVHWKIPLSKPKEINRTGSAGKRRREDKLPPEHVLGYMAEMFANDLQAPRDRYTVSTFALMMCAPGRNMEFHDLPVNCLHREKDRNGVERLGLRFNAGKGYGPDIKWIPTPMVDIATEAVRRLTELTEPARNLAVSLEARPGLSTNEVPNGWPWKNKERGVKWSKALYCMRKYELNSQKATSTSMLWTPGKSAFTFELTERPTLKHHRSIWVRHGYSNPDGSPIRITSHQIRHYLNTLAQRGDLGQLDIAKWSGRANIDQNKTYNHMSEHEILDKVKGEQALQSMAGPLGKVQSNVPVTLKDLNAIGDGAAHVTEFGLCVHDYSMVPCQKHRDCLNCTEHVCIKGDDHKLVGLRRQRDALAQLLAKAEADDESGLYGADRWSAHQLRTLKRVDQLINLLESPDVEDGAIIRLRNDQEFSPLKREIEARGSPKQVESKGPDMDEMRALLGGDLG